MILILIWTLFFSPAWANFLGNDTQNFNPNMNGDDFVTVHSSQALPRGQFNLGLFLNQAHNTLPALTQADGSRVDFSDDILFGDFSMGYGFFENFDLGVNLSYLLKQQADTQMAGARFASVGLNEIRVGSRYHVYKTSRLGFGLASSANFSQVRNSPFAGRDSGPTLNIEAIVDGHLGPSLLALNVGYRMRDQGEALEGAAFEPLPDQVIASLGLSTAISNRWTSLFEIFCSKPMDSVAYIPKERISSEVLLGGRHRRSPHLSFHFGGGTRLTEGLFTPDWRVYMGLQSQWGQPLEKEVIEVKTSDRQSAQYLIYKGYLPGDIVALTEVPFDEMAKRHEFQLKKTVPRDDFDGEKPPLEIVRLDHFNFDFGSSQIKKEHEALLNRLIGYLASAPKVIKLRVEGHTDSLGSLERNKLRSQSRAEAVRDYLKADPKLSDIPIEAIGFGAERPIADNLFQEGRDLNRRVEVRILRNLPPLDEGLREN